MAYPSGPRRGRYIDHGPRKNDKIRAREVRLLSPEGNQIGIVSRDEALQLAKQTGLDLVEISASARPPVCRILDFGKYMYEQAKQKKHNKAKAASTSKVKEIKLRVRVGEHDYMTKLRRAEEFLYKGNKVKVSLMFRGRENEHKGLGLEMVERAGTDLGHVGIPDSTARLSGRHVNMIISPLAKTKRILKFNETVNHEVDSEDDSGEDSEDDETIEAVEE